VNEIDSGLSLLASFLVDILENLEVILASG